MLSDQVKVMKWVNGVSGLVFPLTVLHVLVENMGFYSIHQYIYPTGSKQPILVSVCCFTSSGEVQMDKQTKKRDVSRCI